MQLEEFNYLKEHLTKVYKSQDAGTAPPLFFHEGQVFGHFDIESPERLNSGKILEISGIATEFGVTDLRNEIISDGAFDAASLKGLPFYYNHQHNKRGLIGIVNEANQDGSIVRFNAIGSTSIGWLSSTKNYQSVVDTERLRDASIGLQILSSSIRGSDGKLQIDKAEVFEISLTEAGMHPSAKIEGVKQVVLNAQNKNGLAGLDNYTKRIQAISNRL